MVTTSLLYMNLHAHHFSHILVARILTKKTYGTYIISIINFAHFCVTHSSLTRSKSIGVSHFPPFSKNF